MADVPVIEMSSSRIADLWRRGQEGWPRHYPIAQAPNPPLLVALGGSLLAAVDIGGTAGLLVWAGEEIVAGANLLRRGLCAAAVVWIALDLVGVR
jgi:hypothetical protein